MTTDPQHSSTRSWVVDFAEGSREMRELLGGKGANVAEMTRVPGPEPAGFSRDDIDVKILDRSPFETLDTPASGRCFAWVRSSGARRGPI